jgi:hypothetical protein
MAQSVRFGTALNNFWKEQGSFTRYSITHINDTTTDILCTDPTLKKGIFRAPLIQTLINKIWFKNKEDDGAIHPEFSEDDILPMATVAFVQTVVKVFFFGQIKDHI